MPKYSCQTLCAMVASYKAAGISLASLKAAHLAAIKQSNAPTPRPQLAPRDGATPQQIECNELAYILYLLELLDPHIKPDQAYQNYLNNYNACYGE